MNKEIGFTFYVLLVEYLFDFLLRFLVNNNIYFLYVCSLVFVKYSDG